MAGSVDEEALHQLYLWVDNIPLSRPKRNLSRDFSDGEAQQLGSPKQESAEQTELLGTRGCDAQDRSMRAGRGGASTDSAEAAPGGTPEELAPQDGTGYMDVGLSRKAGGEGALDPQGGGQLREGRLPGPRPPGYSQAVQGDPSFVLQIAEKEQELLASQETVQVLQMKVRRLEHLLQLKNVRIDDLSRRLQQAERKQRRMDRFPEPRSHVQRPGMLPKAAPNPRGSILMLPALGLERQCSRWVHTPRNRSKPSSEDSVVSIQASSLCSGLCRKLPQAAEGDPCPSPALTWDPDGGWGTQQLERKG
ncbi:sperm flagellar protein 1 isoform 2-T2 [Lycaon pictus]